MKVIHALVECETKLAVIAVSIILTGWMNLTVEKSQKVEDEVHRDSEHRPNRAADLVQSGEIQVHHLIDR